MKRKEITQEILNCLNSIPNLRVEYERRQPEDEDELRENGPLAILLRGECERVEVDNAPTSLWSIRWEYKPVIAFFIADADQDEQREALEEIEDAFVTALAENPRLTEDDLLAMSSEPDCKVVFRYPDEAPIGGMEIFLNLTYDR